MFLVDYKKRLDEFDVCTSNLFGSQGFCDVENGKIYKIYFNPKILKYDFSKFESKRIAFPYEYLYDVQQESCDKVIGEVMPYYNYKSIAWSIDDSIVVDKLKNHFSEMINEIKKYFQIRMIDLCTPNILYDKENGFILIDTTPWTISDNGKTNVDINTRCFEYALQDTILSDVLKLYLKVIYENEFTKNIKRYGNSGKELYDALCSSFMDDECRIIEIIEMYKYIFANGEYGPIETLGDMKKYTKMLKNC